MKISNNSWQQLGSICSTDCAFYVHLVCADFHGGDSAGKTNPKRGKKVTVNGKQLAVFLYNGRVYAVLEKCPHMGE